MKTELIKMKSKIIKTAVLAVILSAGAVAAAKMPQAVESFLPVISTVKPQKASYCPTVSADGVLCVDEKGRWSACVSVSEADIPHVELGQTAILSGAAIGDGNYTATVSSISDTAHISAAAGSGRTVVDIVLTLDNPDSLLRSGYTVKAKIKTDDERTICMLSYDLILQDEKGEYVYVLKDETALRREIVTGTELSEGAEIVSGIGFDDDIVENPEKLSGDTRVKLR